MSVLGGERTDPESTSNEDETPDPSPVTTDEDEADGSPDEDPRDFPMEAPGVAVTIDKEIARLLLVLAFGLLLARIVCD